MVTSNEKPAGRVRRAYQKDGENLSISPIITARPLPVNPHLRDLRRQAEERLDAAEISQDWPVYRRHYRVYLALLDAETGRRSGGEA